ncbi:MAG: carotenoid biosynthesis protein [Bacteroidota bacterium]
MGIALGYDTWFIEKTPINLFVSLMLFLLVFAINNKTKITLFLSFFIIGMAVEWLGVNYGILFGDYAYGKNLGPKLDGVPLLIGTYWALLTFTTFSIARHVTQNKWLCTFLGASLMVFLDFLMEKNAPAFNFWEFDGEVPLSNYVTWFLISLLLQIMVHASNIKNSGFQISINLYASQLAFFGYFYLFPIN